MRAREELKMASTASGTNSQRHLFECYTAADADALPLYMDAAGRTEVCMMAVRCFPYGLGSDFRG